MVKNIVDYANNIFGTFSTVAQSLVASELGKVGKGLHTVTHVAIALRTCWLRVLCFPSQPAKQFIVWLDIGPLWHA